MRDERARESSRPFHVFFVFFENYCESNLCAHTAHCAIVYTLIAIKVGIYVLPTIKSYLMLMEIVSVCILKYLRIANGFAERYTNDLFQLQINEMQVSVVAPTEV